MCIIKDQPLVTQIIAANKYYRALPTMNRLWYFIESMILFGFRVVSSRSIKLPVVKCHLKKSGLIPLCPISPVSQANHVKSIPSALLGHLLGYLRRNLHIPSPLYDHINSNRAAGLGRGHWWQEDVHRGNVESPPWKVLISMPMERMELAFSERCQH